MEKPRWKKVCNVRIYCWQLLSNFFWRGIANFSRLSWVFTNKGLQTSLSFEFEEPQIEGMGWANFFYATTLVKIIPFTLVRSPLFLYLRCHKNTLFIFLGSCVSCFLSTFWCHTILHIISVQYILGSKTYTFIKNYNIVD